MTRVLQVLGRSAGGIARHVAQITGSLGARDDLRVDVVAPEGLPVPIPAIVANVTIPDGLFGHRAATKRLEEVIAEGSYDVVHAHGLRAGVDSAGAARRIGVPVIVTVHNLVRPEIAGPVKALVYRQAERLVVTRSSHVLAVSRDIADHLRAYAGDPDRVETLHLGVGDPPPVARTADEVRAALGVAEGKALIVTAARLSPQKALHVLVDAVASLDEAVLAVLGQGELEGELRTQISHRGLTDRVHLLGFRDDAADLIAAADVFTLSSVWEGVPLAAQESILLGTPIVATNVGGMSELVSDRVSGRLVPPNDAVALATAIRDVLTAPEVGREYAAAAKEHLGREFSTERMLERLVALYEESA